MKIQKAPEARSATGPQGTFTASPRQGTNPVTKVTELVEWVVYGPDGELARVPAAEFAADGQRMLDCYATGQPYTPAVKLAGETLAPKMAWDKRRELLESGRDQCYQVDEFSRSLAVDEAEQEGMFRTALERHSVEQWPGLQRELFARLLGSAEPASEVSEADQWLQIVHEQTEETEEWTDLAAQCKGDPWAAGLGAACITDLLGAMLDEKIKQHAPQQDPERLNEEANDLEEMAPGAGQLKQEEASEALELAEALRNELASEENQLLIRQVVRTAAIEAEAEIASVQQGMVGLGVGYGGGVLSAVNAPSDEVRKALRDNAKLRRIAELAGRLRMRARDKQRSKVNYVPEQIVDVTLGADLQRLLPSELLLLGTEETELLLLKRLAERQALQYALEGRESEDQGPIVLCVDGSGSMDGPRHEWAMAVGLALMEVCAIQRRAFGLCHYDGTVQKTHLVPHGTRVTLAQLIEMVCFFSGGGTNFTPPLEWSRQTIERGEWKKSDVILVTDGGSGDVWLPAVVKLNDLGAQVFGVAIESDFRENEKPALAGVARIENLAMATGKGGAGGALQRQGKASAKDGQIDLVFGAV